MCGRFVSREQAAVEREYHIKVRNPFERVYNAAPSMSLPVIRVHAGEREALTMRWGLIPGWWSQATLPTATINARSEDAAAKPMWRGPVRHTRCLVPALGWYEWQTGAAGKVPFFIHARADGDALPGFCFAGLWSAWKNPQGQEQLSFAILTRPASPALETVHNRMPVVLPEAAFDDWLDDWPGEHAARLAACVQRSRDDFAFYPVSRYVNTPRNQGERCIAPAAATE